MPTVLVRRGTIMANAVHLKIVKTLNNESGQRKCSKHFLPFTLRVTFSINVSIMFVLLLPILHYISGKP